MATALQKSVSASVAARNAQTAKNIAAASAKDTTNKVVSTPTVLPKTNSTPAATTQPDLSINNPKYKALIDKGYTPEQISSVWSGIQANKPKVTLQQSPINTPTSDINAAMDKFTKDEGMKTNSMGEWIDRPTKEQVDRFNEKFTTVTPTSSNDKKDLGNWDYQDTSTKRQTEILKNLETAYANNPSSFANETEFNKTYNVGTGLRVAQQDQWIKNRYQGKKATELAQQQAIQALTKFKTMTNTELGNLSDSDAATIMNSGDVELQQKRQQAKIDKQNLDLINGISKIQQKILDTTYTDSNLYDDYKKEIDSTLSPLTTKVTDAKIAYETLQTQYDNIMADVENEYKGSGATQSYINALASKRQQTLLPQLQQAQIKYNNLANQFNSQKELLTQEYQMKQQDIENEKADLTQQLSVFNTIWNANMQQQQLESGKYTAIADGLGGFVVLNTKTGKFETSGGGVANTPSTSGGGGVTNEQRAGYTTDQKSQIVDQMMKMEGGEKSAAYKYNNPAALTRPSTKAFQDILKQYGGEPVKASNGYTYVKFPSMEQGKAATIAYIDKAGFTYGGGKQRRNYTNQLGFGGGGAYTEGQQQALKDAAAVKGDPAKKNKILKDAKLSQTDLDNYLSEQESSLRNPFSQSEILRFNKASVSDYSSMTDNDKARYDLFQEQKSKVFENPNTSMEDILQYSKGQAKLDPNSKAVYKGVSSVIGQLGGLKDNLDQYQKNLIGGNKWSNLEGYIRNVNPRDTKSQQIKGELIALVPQIAKGVFGEKGVLSDQDIRNYMKTLPSLKQTTDVKDAILLTLLGTLKSTLSSNLRIDASNNDVSQQAGRYKQISDEYNRIYKKVVDTNPKLSNSQGVGNILTPESAFNDVFKNKSGTGTSSFSQFF